ncbi:mechanosensitive ion channel family protein [Polaribacter glomeratus]|uniref:Mechanosensitive ion channel protein MscS n=1 Tax=Polaribacter glomeratus TaxID=102 RepID=A0A2S7WWE3_9FLAO|nr:mechanosensitive ion channel family protein [Polaribacter glomeratus]PQJ81888.1 hypothetical protein BTO16_04575 [Polaribacter glomeratus]TXD64376.1 mechanosensitive ion channel family protein [Polaribacter glomeratus]
MMKDVTHTLFQETSLLIHAIVIATITFVFYFVVNKSINKFIKKHANQEEFDATNYRFLQRALSLLIVLIGLSFIIFLVPSLRHIATTILAGAGVIVAVIGFASQQVLANIISGIMIVITKPYRLKDTISLRNIEGKVEDITLRHTVIKNYENKRIIVPNSVMNSEVIVNSNFADDICCEWVEIGIAFTANIKHAKAIMKEEIIKNPLFIDHRNAKQIEKLAEIVPVRVITIGDFSVTLRAWTWAANPGDAFILGCELKESIKDRFEKEGIEMPYPYTNIIQRKLD